MKKMKKIITILWVFALFSPALLWANTAFAVSTMASITATTPTAITHPQNPVEVIQTTIAKLNALTRARYTSQAMQILVSREIAPLFDFNHIARQVLFANGVHLNAGEHQFFVKKLQQNIVTALLSKLNQAGSTSFSFISAKPIFGNNIVLSLQVIGYSPFSFYVDLLFHQGQNQQWKIADIVLNNDSLINYYQRVVSIKIKRYGVYGMLSRI